ncbi:hypothetical protein [Jeotgalibacillus proteolyticus]|uniref:hypothetical protein n=1 Tax=Jeotgalibacillus proteolyticus TaxID=2082395 RepID=UPI001FD6C66A|nr:hypothetical protein [Jeotgalibacillus proteolyticus]
MKKEALFEDGVKWIEEHTSLPVLGVLPHVENHGIEQEDSLGVRAVSSPISEDKKSSLQVAVIELPYVSNFTDIEALVHEPGISLKWVRRPEELTATPDLIILPGTKSTINSLRELKQHGWEKHLRHLQKEGVWIMGICGGLQLLGDGIEDPHGIDSGIRGISENGFGFIPSSTVMKERKTVTRQSGFFYAQDCHSPVRAEGFEIHLGVTQIGKQEDAHPFLMLDDGQTEGYWSDSKRVFGTYLHDIFREPAARHFLINRIKNSLGKEETIEARLKRNVYDELAASLKPHLDWEKIRGIMGL